MSAVREYSLERATVIFMIGGKRYELREATGDAIVRYRNARAECSVYGPTGDFIRVKGLADLDPLFVSLCLYDEKEKLVPEQTIKSWPARIQADLAKELKIISDVEYTTPEKEALKRVLAHKDCPVDALAFQNFILSLEGDEYEAIKRWALVDPEDNSKN